MTEELEIVYGDRVFYVDIWWTVDLSLDGAHDILFRVNQIDEALPNGNFAAPCPPLTQPELAELTKLARVEFDNEMERRATREN